MKKLLSSLILLSLLLTPLLAPRPLHTQILSHDRHPSTPSSQKQKNKSSPEIPLIKTNPSTILHSELPPQPQLPLFLLDKKKHLAATIDPEDLSTITLTNGQPVAYIQRPHVYGFNGKHLGWFREGLIFNHEGYVVCLTSSKNPQKSVQIKQNTFNPPHAPKKLYPLPPTNLFYSFAQEYCSLFLAQGYLNH